MTNAAILAAVSAELSFYGPDKITFAPIRAELAEKLQGHPGMVCETRLHWRPDGLVELELTDVNGDKHP